MNPLQIDTVSGSSPPHARSEGPWPARLLVVDDDPGFRRLSALALEEVGLEYVAVSTAREALHSLQAPGTKPFDLILLDMELPGMKGWELLKLLRDSGRDIPVILVTVCEGVQEKVRALDLGADDYVVKPCSFQELLSRLQAVMRRVLRRCKTRVGDLEIDPLLRRVRRNGRPINLTPREFELLALLASESGRTLSKAELLSRLWRLESEPGTNFLQVHFSRLKQKLEPMKGARIETIYGIGYRLVLDA